MTDEELALELRDVWKTTNQREQCVFDALARRARELLAAPQAPILGMTQLEIKREFEKHCSNSYAISVLSIVAHRLARPVAAVDEDKRAKNELYDSMMNVPDDFRLGCHIDELWSRLTGGQRDFWRNRAVAKAMEGRDG